MNRNNQLTIDNIDFDDIKNFFEFKLLYLARFEKYADCKIKFLEIENFMQKVDIKYNYSQILDDLL